ncbi:MAG: hypothetical protein ACPLSP_03500, partial [Fervidicoccus fontis]
MSKNLTSLLINLIRNDQKIVEIDLVDSLIDVASKNKVLLQVLVALNVENSLRASQEEAMKGVVRVVKCLSEALRDFNYAFFKLVKPVSYVPADVDILVRSDERKEVVEKI